MAMMLGGKSMTVALISGKAYYENGTCVFSGEQGRNRFELRANAIRPVMAPVRPTAISTGIARLTAKCRVICTGKRALWLNEQGLCFPPRSLPALTVSASAALSRETLQDTSFAIRRWHR